MGLPDNRGGFSSQVFSPWDSRGTWLPLPNQTPAQTDIERSYSYTDVPATSSLEAVMQEFRMNGSDSPYDPDDDSQRNPGLRGFGPSSEYLRQRSWPAPNRTPAHRLPRGFQPNVQPVPSTPRVQNEVQYSAGPYSDWITAEQLRVLKSLPKNVVSMLLRMFDIIFGRRRECSFCRSNGERASFCASHVLHAATGKVRCPVLRALVCLRCGATGDHAHTLKYCPLTPKYVRNRSYAMVRSKRLASGRRRANRFARSADEFARFSAPSPSAVQGVNYFETPLEPPWADLEKKLIVKILQNTGLMQGYL